MQSGAMKLNVNKLLMDSPEVKLNEIFVSNIFNGDGQIPNFEDSLIACKIRFFKEKKRKLLAAWF